MIENEKEWTPNTSSVYYCNYLCGQRNHACEYKAQFEKKAEIADSRHYNPETESFE